jgi:hypothetical protein
MNQAVHGCASAACSPRLHARFKELKEWKVWGGLAQAASFPHSTAAVRRRPGVLVEWRPTRRRKRWNETERNKCVREFTGTGNTGCSALRIGGPSELGALFDCTARTPIGMGLLILIIWGQRLICHHECLAPMLYLVEGHKFLFVAKTFHVPNMNVRMKWKLLGKCAPMSYVLNLNCFGC